MPLHVVLGKPGSGKSRFSTGLTVEELRESKRFIVGNVPWKLSRLNEVLQERYPGENCEVATRVRLLDEIELRWFWKFRTPDDAFPAPLRAKLEEAMNLPPDDLRRVSAFKEADVWSRTPTTSDNGAGVAYFLDECHIAFNARDWAQLGRACIHYLSQHRKLGDVVYAITQSAGNLDKQFRSVAEDFTVLRNERVAQYGIFRGRDRFTWKTFLSEPSSNSVPFKEGAFPLDAQGLGSCYDTASGIGVNGSKADIGRRAKGISIMWVIPAALLAALGCVFVPWALGKASSTFIAGDVKAKADEVKGGGAVRSVAGAVGGLVAARAPGDDRDGVPAPLEPIYADDTPERALWVTGWVTDGRRVNVQLSDGRVLTEEDSELFRFSRNSVRLRTGQRLFIMARRPVPGAQVQPVQPVAPPVPLAPFVTDVPRESLAGSWRLDSDGVYRLAAPSSIGAGLR